MILAFIYLPILLSISWLYKDHERSNIIHAINLIFFLIPLAYNDEGAIFCVEFGSIWIAWGMSWNLKHGKAFFLTGISICIVALILFIVLNIQDLKGSQYAFISIYGLIAIAILPLFGFISIMFRLGEYLGPRNNDHIES